MLELIPTCLHSLAVIKFHVSFEVRILCYHGDELGYIFHIPQDTDDTIFLSVVQSDM